MLTSPPFSGRDNHVYSTLLHLTEFIVIESGVSLLGFLSEERDYIVFIPLPVSPDPALSTVIYVVCTQ